MKDEKGEAASHLGLLVGSEILDSKVKKNQPSRRGHTGK